MYSFQTIHWHDLLDTGLGSKYWHENQTVTVIRVPHRSYPPTVLNGIAPQKVFNQEAVHHIDPNGDEANVLEVGIGIEEPPVPSIEEAWSESITHDTSNREPLLHNRNRFLQHPPGPDDHLSTFIREKMQSFPSPTRFWNPQLESAISNSRGWNNSSTSGGSKSDTRSSDLSTMTTPRYQVDHTIDTPFQGYSVKTVTVLVKDGYTQVSAECQDSGFGRFGMPYELSKVTLFYNYSVSILLSRLYWCP